MILSVLNFGLWIVSLLCQIIWFLSNFAIFLIHYFFVLLLVLCVVSKFISLKAAPINILENVFGFNSWCISYLGAHFDVPENSKASLEYSISKNCPRILFSLELTSCGKLVVLDKQTLEKANIHKPISKTIVEEIKSINISEYHPLGKQYGEQKILTVESLLKFMEPFPGVVVVLHSNNTNAIFIEKLKQVIQSNEPEFTRKFIFCCKSPLAIYKIRKLLPDLVCGIWIDSLSNWRTNKRIFKILTILRSIYDVVFRNLIAPIIGISLVFIHKEEFNVHISELWNNVGVIPVVYFVNSPSEKRYYQNVIKTRYLTSSLRSEPQIIFSKA